MPVLLAFPLAFALVVSLGAIALVGALRARDWMRSAAVDADRRPGSPPKRADG